MGKHEVLKKYANWIKEHPDEDYQYDQLHEFVDELNRGDMLSFMDCVLHVTVRFSDIDKIAWEKIEQEYEQEDIESDDEIMQGEITTALEWYKQGIRDALQSLL